MAKPAEGVSYTRPSSQLDNEARLAVDNAVTGPLVAENPNPKAEEGFVGVGFEYQNFANETDKPLTADEGVDKDLEQLFSDAIKGEPQPGPQAYQDNYKIITRQDDVSEAPAGDNTSVAGGQAHTTSEEPADTEGSSVSGGTPTKF
jgi:hypothetical protein